MEMMKIVLLAVVALSSGGPAVASPSTLTQLAHHEEQQEKHFEKLDDAMKVVFGALHNNNILIASNLALKKACTQSSTIDGEVGLANHAVDGELSCNAHNNTCTHTKNELNPWWQVDFGRKVYFSRVLIKNRADCCGERLFNFDVKVRNGDAWKTVSDYPDISTTGEIIEFTFPMELAQVLRIQIKGTSPLTLCEVQVFLK